MFFNRKKFNEDVKRGDIGENEVYQLFENCNIKLVSSKTVPEEREFWDFRGNLDLKRIFKIEVKTDEMEEKTNNLAIEYGRIDIKNGEVITVPSGIRITKSDLWHHIIYRCGKPLIYSTSVKKLKNFMQRFEPKAIKPIGDGGKSICWLYTNTYIIPSIFKRIDKMNEKQLREYLNSELND